ncbi:hypothetical protein [Bacillus cereus group sp. BfR-BA-01309]|uniref:hypothetical protein n=1 Tax=Bacillus cereus group sp. BfR-BA-01309 TaxID=2920286 RepID=UPI001F5A1D64|nr:hypothetical protein [Bacillus cereus group sp. BfR-BA-01309]
MANRHSQKYKNNNTEKTEAASSFKLSKDDLPIEIHIHVNIYNYNDNNNNLANQGGKAGFTITADRNGQISGNAGTNANQGGQVAKKGGQNTRQTGQATRENNENKMQESRPTLFLPPFS